MADWSGEVVIMEEVGNLFFSACRWHAMCNKIPRAVLFIRDRCVSVHVCYTKTQRIWVHFTSGLVLKVTLCVTVTICTMCARESQLGECAVSDGRAAKNTKDNKTTMMQTIWQNRHRLDSSAINSVVWFGLICLDAFFGFISTAFIINKDLWGNYYTYHNPVVGTYPPGALWRQTCFCS